MHRVMVAGAGHIGSLIARLLADSGDYCVSVLDQSIGHLGKSFNKENLTAIQIDACDDKQMHQFIEKHPQDAVVCALPYFCNLPVAKFAKQHQLNYFGLTEDAGVAKAIAKLADDAKTMFVPQCGLAPGFINILANHMMQEFDELDTVKMRVGNLPSNTSHALQYALTWSIDGLINEYGNLCHGILNGEQTIFQPLQNIETVEIDGIVYEAFNTSGGIGTLSESYQGKVKNMNYKTLRYPGHCLKMRFLMQDLLLNEDRDTLKKILEKALPKSTQDVTIIYVSITGKKSNEYLEENYVNKIYPKDMFDKEWSAIQATTASGVCAVIDLLLPTAKQTTGLVLQEQINLTDLIANRFGRIFNQTQ